MNALTRRVSKLEVETARCADKIKKEEYWRTVEERIWEARRSRLTKEELVLEERKRAILREACRGHRTIAEAIWHGQAALRNFAKMEAGQE
jgi:hypothetical protein